MSYLILTIIILIISEASLYFCNPFKSEPVDKLKYNLMIFPLFARSIWYQINLFINQTNRNVSFIINILF